MTIRIQDQDHPGSQWAWIIWLLITVSSHLQPIFPVRHRAVLALKTKKNLFDFDNEIYLWTLLLIVCRVSRMLWSRRRKIFTVKKQIKNILTPHLEQNISLPFSFPFPVKYCEIIQAGVSKLILKRLHIPLRYQKLIMSVILILFYFFKDKNKPASYFIALKDNIGRRMKDRVRVFWGWNNVKVWRITNVSMTKCLSWVSLQTAPVCGTSHATFFIKWKMFSPRSF